MFENFLKALAWLIGKLIWYCEISISDKLFLGILAQQNLEQVMLDELQSGLRAKPPAKPRTKKLGMGTAAASAAEATPDAPKADEPADDEDDDDGQTNDPDLEGLIATI
jgi:hypothetical protein